MKSYDKVTFGSRNLAFFELSPYYYSTFVVDGIKYRTLIHYWCCSYIFKLKNNRDLREMVRNTNTPEQAINYVKRWGFVDFHQVDPKDFIKGIQERFNQCDGIRTILLSTGLTELVYFTKKDFLGKNNRYGRLIMRVREMYYDS